MQNGTGRTARHLVTRFCRAGVLALVLLTGIAGALPSVANPLEREASLTDQRRKEIQHWLVWAGVYNGRVDGDFGAGTRRAIGRFQDGLGQPATGYLTDEQLAKLSVTAEAVKRLYRFETYTDPAGRFEIGIPEALLAENESPASAALQRESADEAVSLKVYTYPVEDGTELDALFAAVAATSERRSAEYKVLRRDWFVVSGSDGGFNFYTRADSARDLIVIFTFIYPATRSRDLDRVTIAIANSFRLWPERGEKPAQKIVAAPPTKADAPVAEKPERAEFDDWKERLQASRKALPLDDRSQVGRLTSGIQLVDADPGVRREGCRRVVRRCAEVRVSRTRHIEGHARRS